jgi:hypothetical protein
MTDVEEVEVVVAHHEGATLRVGDVFLKIDADQTRSDVEVDAMTMAPMSNAAPAAKAWPASSAASLVLPICGGPETNTRRPRPRLTDLHVPRSQRISCSRSTSGVDGSSSGGTASRS